MENTEPNQNSEDQVVDKTSGEPHALEDEQSESQETVTTPEKTEVKDGTSDENVETEDEDTTEITESEDSKTTIRERSPGKDRGIGDTDNEDTQETGECSPGKDRGIGDTDNEDTTEIGERSPGKQDRGI